MESNPTPADPEECCQSSRIDPCIEEQQATIPRLQQELAQKDEILNQELEKKDVIIARIKRGHGLSIRDVWEDYKYRNPWCKLRMEPSFCAMPLDLFLRQMVISWGYLKAAQDVFQAASASEAKGSVEPPSMQDASATPAGLQHEESCAPLQ